MRTLSCLLAFIFGAAAEAAPPLENLTYPPLARAAQVQGDVVISNGKFVTGPPLLAESAKQNASLLGLTEVVLHYRLVPTTMSNRTGKVSRGDAFERFFLRVLRISTTREIHTAECVQNPNVPPNRMDSSRAPVEIWIYHAEGCLMTVG